MERRGCYFDLNDDFLPKVVVDASVSAQKHRRPSHSSGGRGRHAGGLVEVRKVLAAVGEPQLDSRLDIPWIADATLVAHIRQTIEVVTRVPFGGAENLS